MGSIFKNLEKSIFRATYKGEASRVAMLLLLNRRMVDARDALQSTPLHHAVMYRRIDVARMLLNKGADVDAKNHDGNGPLHFASSEEMIELLIGARALVNEKNNDGNTPLHKAAYNGLVNVMELLISNGARIDVVNKENMTPLHLAVQEGHREVAAFLITKGASVNTADGLGNTPLHIAAGGKLRTDGSGDLFESWYEESKAMVELLIQKGASVNARNKESATPLQLAKKKGFKDTAIVIALHGGKEM